MSTAGTALVIGEALIDVTTDASGRTVEHPGGSAANTALALGRLGRPVRLVTALGDDPRGRRIRSWLDQAGVQIDDTPQVDRTSVAQARIGADGSASYTFDLEWTPRAPAVPDEVSLVHISSIEAQLPSGGGVADLVDSLPAALVSLDVNARPSITGTGEELTERVETMARRATLVRASDEDLAAIYPERGIEAAAARLLALGAAAVVVTRGGDGASWFSPTWSVATGGVKTIVVDTIGAGDTFGAALLHQLWSIGASGADARDTLTSVGRDQAASLLAVAARAAAVTVGRAGMDPPRAV